MNKKKLIGTIVGVVAFIILIAGATYAWLTQALSVTGGNYSGTTKNFVIDYSGGSQVTGLKQIASGSATTGAITNAADATATTDGWIQVTAAKGTTAPKASHFYLKLTMSDNTLDTDSLMYAVCHGACPTEVALATPSNATSGATCATGVTSCGTVPGGDTTDVVLLDDTTNFNVDGTVSTQTYNVYFWLDSTTMSDNDIGATFSGEVVASATQGE